MRVGLFGGRFDPPHFGHLLLARDLVEKGILDEVRFLVNYHPPHKEVLASYFHRVRMVEILIGGERGLRVDTFEGELGISPSYTYHVLRAYREKFKFGELYFILGADQMAEIKSWKNYLELPNLAKFLVLARGDINIPEEIKRLFNPILVKHRLIEISSSEIRRRLKEGLSVKGLTAEGVIDYITVNGLYVGGSNYEVFVDGGSKGNPGVMKYAFVVRLDGREIYKEFGEIGYGTNNEAEYNALLKALRWLKENRILGAKIYMDSQLVVNQIKGLYSVEAENLKELKNLCENLLNEIFAKIEHIDRKMNIADKFTRL